MNWREFSDEYLNVLRGTLKGLNLTRILDPEEFFSKQIMDSLAPLEQSAVFKDCIEKTGLLVDVGFGGGFPLVPLCKALPEVNFLGIEKVRKKIDAVKIICEHFSLNNVKFSHQNLLELYIDKSCVITLKAVGTLANFLPMLKTNKQIYVFFYKGPNFHELEGEDLKKLSKDWEIIEEKSLAVEGAGDRLLVGLRNINVPRGTKKNQINLTSLI